MSPFENVRELRQLVYFSHAQELAHVRNARILADGYGQAAARSVVDHCAKLVN